MQLAWRHRSGKPLAQNPGLGTDPFGIGIKAIAVTIRTCDRPEHHDGFATFADFIEGGLADNLRRAFATGGKGFVVRH